MKSALQQATPPKVDPKAVAIEAVEKAFTRMRSSLDIGLSYNNYQVALLELAQSVAELKRTASNLSPASGDLLSKALEAYADAGTFWHKSIEFYAKRDNNLSYGGGLPVQLTGLEWLVGKYNLATAKSDLFGFYVGLPVQTTQSTLWQVAANLAHQGIARAKSIQPDAVATPAEPAGKVETIVSFDALSWVRPTDAPMASRYTPGTKGVEFAGQPGSDIRAACAGTVVFAGNGLIGYGNLVIIKHNDRYLTAYAQNATLLAKAGDVVAQGQAIATMGTSLVYEVRKHGLAVDPTPYLPK